MPGRTAPEKMNPYDMSRRLWRKLGRSLVSGIPLMVASNAWADTSQFRGVIWGDSRDNFQSGVLYVSGLSSSDT